MNSECPLNPAVALPTATATGGSTTAGFILVITQSETPLAKRAHLQKVNRERQFIKAKRAKLTKIMAQQLKALGKDLAKQVTSKLDKSEASLIETIISNLGFTKWQEATAEKVKPYLSAIAVDGGETTLEAMGLFTEEVAALMRVRALEWAEYRSAEMVGMKWVNGELVQNPNAFWTITEPTRDALRSTIQNGLSEGMSMDELSKEIEASHAFSPSRAKVIARTETAKADVAGTMQSYRSVDGVIGKQWLTADDEKVSDDCRLNESAGIIPLNATFPAGDDAPPNHPNCRCDIAAIFADNE